MNTTAGETSLGESQAEVEKALSLWIGLVASLGVVMLYVQAVPLLAMLVP